MQGKKNKLSTQNKWKMKRPANRKHQGITWGIIPRVIP